MRRRRSCVLRALIEEIAEKGQGVSIFDVGGRRSYWNIFDDEFLERCGVRVTLVNREAPGVGANEGSFRFVTGDACRLEDIGEGEFDLAHSNSTIEHVGDWSRVQAFAAETRRVGKSYYVQTPYFWFPIEPHFLLPGFQFLPDGLRAKALVANLAPHKGKSPDIGHAMARVQGARLLDWTQMRFLFPDAEVKFEWVGPFAKSVIAVRGPGGALH